MKTATYTGKNQKFNRKVREESVEAIQTKFFSEILCDPLNNFF